MNIKLDVDTPAENYYFPINISQVEDLLGKMLTHIEAMNLPQQVEKANKSLVRQTIWRWWDFAQENSMTSYKGCIGPIEVRGDSYVWHSEFGKTEGTSGVLHVHPDKRLV